MKILKLWTPTKCAKIIALINVRGVSKTSWQWLLNCVKQQNPTFIFHCALKASSWRVFRFLGGPQVWVPPRTPKTIFSNFCCQIWTPPNLNFIDPRRQNSTYEKRNPPEESNISIFTSCSKIMLPVRKSAHICVGR